MVTFTAILQKAFQSENLLVGKVVTILLSGIQLQMIQPIFVRDFPLRLMIQKTSVLLPVKLVSMPLFLQEVQFVNFVLAQMVTPTLAYKQIKLVESTFIEVLSSLLSLKQLGQLIQISLLFDTLVFERLEIFDLLARQLLASSLTGDKFQKIHSVFVHIFSHTLTLKKIHQLLFISRH